MHYAGIQVGIASWRGPGTLRDSRMPQLLQATAGTSFRWTLYYEEEGLSNPTESQITSDLIYIRDHYGNDPSYLRLGGRFVVFVYAGAGDDCSSMAYRWQQANTVGAYLVLKIFPGYRTCAYQPDHWHQYSPTGRVSSQLPYSYSLSPGFWQPGQSVTLARDLMTWKQNIRDMVASGADFQLITTFNQWGDGTAVENAQQWPSVSNYGDYLDALHTDGF